MQGKIKLATWVLLVGSFIAHGGEIQAKYAEKAKVESATSSDNIQEAIVTAASVEDDAVAAVAGTADILEDDSTETQAFNQRISDSDKWYRKSYAAYQNKKYSQALAYIQQAITLYPEYSEYYNLESYIYIKLQDYSNAIKAADAGLKVAENNPEFYEIKANCLQELKQTDSALDAYRKMFQFRNDFDGNVDARWFYNYINFLSEMNLPDELIKVYAAFQNSLAEGEEIDNIEKHAGDIHFYASLAFKRKGNADAEMTALNEAIKASPDFGGYYNNRGNLFDDAKKYTEALTDYNKGISLDKKSADLFYNRGHTYVLIKNYEKALKDLLQAEKLGMKDDKLYLMMGNAYKGVKNYDYALTAYQKVLAINPANTQVQNNLAILYKEMGRPELAGSAYQQASNTDSNAEVPLYNQANDLMHSGKYLEAIVFFKQAIAIKPDFTDALNQLGICHVELDQYDLALVVLTKAIALKENDSMLYMNRATAYKGLKKIDLAKEDYLTVLKLDPTRNEAYYTLGKLQAEQGNIEAGMQYYKLAEDSGLDIAEYYTDYSAFLLANNKAEAALKIALKGIGKYPNNYKLLVNLASAYDETGDEKRTEATLKKAIDIDPHNYSAYYNLGNLYFLVRKDLPQAEKYYINAIENNAELVDAYLNLASVYAGMGKKDLAFQTYEKLLSRSPDNYEAYYNRGAYYVELGSTVLGIADFEKSFTLMDRALLKQKNNTYDLGRLKSKNSLLKAQAYQSMSRFDQAIPAYESYLSFNSKDATALSNYGFVLIEIGSLQKAAASLEKSYLLNKKEIDSVVGLIAVNYLLNDKATVSKYKSTVKRDFSDYRLSADMLDDLSKYGYAYTDTFKRIWKDAVSK